jgi:hypothetical protein
MLDDFRQQADSSGFFEEDEEPGFPDPEIQVRRQFLGMTPLQRFVIAVLLLVIVCLIGAFGLLVMEKIVLPFA